jgi:hypothetical protein
MYNENADWKNRFRSGIGLADRIPYVQITDPGTKKLSYPAQCTFINDQVIKKYASHLFQKYHRSLRFIQSLQ